MYKASHVYGKSKHTLCTMNEQLFQAVASTIVDLESITHLCTFSDDGVYVALIQHTPIVVESDE